MKKFNNIWVASVCALVLVYLTANIAEAASEADLNNPLICAATEAVQCQETQNCVQGPANLFNLPVFFRINFRDKIVESIREDGERRTSRINIVETKNGAILLQGTDGNAVWLATIQASSGKMTVTSAQEGLAFIVFGSCTPL